MTENPIYTALVRERWSTTSEALKIPLYAEVIAAERETRAERA